MREGYGMKELGLFLFLVVIWTAGQVFLKLGMNELAGEKVNFRFFGRALSLWQVLAGLMCSVVGALIWLVILSRFNLGFSNLVGCLTLVLVALASMFVFKEPMPFLKWLGAALIVLGVFIISRTG
jgi:drug/metabolite transporter (DMT)-like permease